MVKKYIPNQGDIVFLDSPLGHEQSGYRPAIVISNDIFNLNTKMVIVCPITSNTRSFPTHYLLQDTNKVSGSVLCEHIRSIDYDVRRLKFVEKTSHNDFNNIVMLLNACID